MCVCVSYHLPVDAGCWTDTAAGRQEEPEESDGRQTHQWELRGFLWFGLLLGYSLVLFSIILFTSLFRPDRFWVADDNVTFLYVRGHIQM